MGIVEEHIRHHLQSLVNAPIDSWGDLEDIIVKKEIKKGQHFFEHFDNCDEVAIVSKGLFRIYLINTDGEEKTFSFIKENGFILDFFLSFDNSPSNISIQALEDSKIYTIKYSKFLSLMNSKRVWNDIYREVLLRNYMSKTKREIEFVLHNARERLNLFKRSQGSDVERIPKTYLASYLGIAPPSLSRLLREEK